MGVKLGFSV